METAIVLVVNLLALSSMLTFVGSDLVGQERRWLQPSTLGEGHRWGGARPTLHAFSKQSPRRHGGASFGKGRDEEAQKIPDSWWAETRPFSIQKGSPEINEMDSRKSRIFYVTDHGADPTGLTDSTTALQMTINRAFEVASTHSLLTGIIDLGGVEVHLAGGEYVISRPLSFPDMGGGNLLIHGGTIRASASFPSDGHLIELASSLSHLSSAEEQQLLAHHSNGATYAYEDVTLRDLMLDASYIGGGILVVNSLRTTIENCYITHFATTGISVRGGHETFIHDCFLGQHITAGGDAGESGFSGTAIELAGNDNAITDVVIFSAEVGVMISGQANILTGVHCYNKATGYGGVGILLKLPGGSSQTRILGCYLDYTGIVIDDPSQVTIANTFFLGDASILLRSTSPRSSISGLSIVDNMFSGIGANMPIVVLDQSLGAFTSIRQTIVDRNSASGMALKSTRARATVSGFGTNWTLDFSGLLLFPDTIKSVQYSFYTAAPSFPRHALRSVASNRLVVASDMDVLATVAAVVDQSDTVVFGSDIYTPAGS